MSQLEASCENLELCGLQSFSFKMEICDYRIYVNKRKPSVWHIRTSEYLYRKCLIFVWLYSEFPVFQLKTLEEIFVLYSGDYGNRSQCRFFSHKSFVPYKLPWWWTIISYEGDCNMHEIKIFEVEIVTLVMR